MGRRAGADQGQPGAVWDGAVGMSDAVIVRLDGASRMLAEAKTIQQAKKIMDMADAAKVYARQQKLGQEATDYANSIKIEAMRRLGQLWKEAPKHPGTRVSPLLGGSQEKPPSKLSELGINKKLAHICAKLAELPKEEYEQVRDGIVSMAKALNNAKLKTRKSDAEIEAAKSRGHKQVGVFVSDLNSLPLKKYGCIYVDPPWKYLNQGTRGATDNHYETMTVEELCRMPIAKIAADKSHIHLWVTNGFLFEAPKILKAWGFEFKSTFVWVKPQMGMGNYWRNSHEILLLGVRGGLTASDRGLMSWIEESRRSHSQKPDSVREMITRLSPGPYLELFGRSKISGWDVFGNQILQEAA